MLLTESVTVADLVKNARLDVYYGKEYLEERTIWTADISRPGLELTGFFNYYPAKRIQLLGITEISYSKGISHEELLDVMQQMCQPETPAFVVSKRNWIRRKNCCSSLNDVFPVLGSKLTTSRVLSNMTNYLDDSLRSVSDYMAFGRCLRTSGFNYRR